MKKSEPRTRVWLSNGAKIQLLQVFLCCMIGALVLTNYLAGKEQERILWRGSLLVNRLDVIAKLNADIKDIQIDVIQVQQYLQDVSATRGLDGLNDGFELAEKNAKAFETHARAAIKTASELKIESVVTVLKDVMTKFPVYYETGLKMANVYVAEEPSAGNKMMGEFDAKAESLHEAVAKLTLAAEEESRAAGHEAVSLQKNSARFQMISLAIGLLAFLAGAASVGFTILLDRRAKEQERQAIALQQQQVESERQKSESSAAIIVSLGQGLSELAKGDLTHAIETPFPQGFEPLREHFNSTCESLKRAIESVKDGSDRILRGVSEIAQASDDLSRRTESQAASLEQTSAAVAEISAAVKKNAENSDEARIAALDAMQEAAASSAVVLKAVTAMHEIKQSSGRIQQIIGVIDEIAFQTNLLALNAGVEAARAGDAGRGFAVVAAEVRALSDRSAAAARDIKSLLDVSSGQVEGGVELVEQAGAALKNISARITSISSIIGGLNSSAQHQASGLQEVSQAVEQMDKVTQQNAAMVEETTAATRALSQQTDELAGMIAAFRTGDTSLAA